MFQSSMDMHQVFSSPPQSPQGQWPTYRHLSDSATPLRRKAPWRQRFRQQCMQRIKQAREDSVLLQRQLQAVASPGSTYAPVRGGKQGRLPAPKHMRGLYSDDDSDSEDEHGGAGTEHSMLLTEQDIQNLIAQEWRRFQCEYRQQCEDEQVSLDELAELEMEIQQELRHGPATGAGDTCDEEAADYERYEIALAAEQEQEQQQAESATTVASAMPNPLPGVVCPACHGSGVHRLAEGSSLIRCFRCKFTQNIQFYEHVMAIQSEHGGSCNQELGLSVDQSSMSIIAYCPACDFCQMC